MTKRELVEVLAEKNHMTQKTVDGFLQNLFDVIETNMANGVKTQLTGLGTFDLGYRKGRRGVDPQTHQEIQIPGMNMPRFRAGKDLKAAAKGL